MLQQMALGSFVFSLSSGFPYERLRRETDGGWIDIEIVNSKPYSQNSGQDLERLRIVGRAHRAAGMEKLATLRAMADGRTPYAIVDALGRNWGRWRLDKVLEEQTGVIDDGTAMTIDWTLELREFRNENSAKQSGG
ncbi:MAG: phage tail protein [Pseudomonadota bacterium]|nr:phage tail protein [Pseudomonadota bacterium]